MLSSVEAVHRTRDAVAVTAVMRRRLRDQPVLRLRELWNPQDPDSGAGQALARLFAEATRQRLAIAGTAYIRMAPATADGQIPGEAALPVERPGTDAGEIEAVTVPGTPAISTLYRDTIHLEAGAAVVRLLQNYADAKGLTLDGEPRWIYHTDPDWNLEPDDQLIEVLWPYH